MAEALVWSVHVPLAVLELNNRGAKAGRADPKGLSEAMSETDRVVCQYFHSASSLDNHSDQEAGNGALKDLCRSESESSGADAYRSGASTPRSDETLSEDQRLLIKERELSNTPDWTIQEGERDDPPSVKLRFKEVGGERQDRQRESMNNRVQFQPRQRLKREQKKPVDSDRPSESSTAVRKIRQY